VYGYNEEAGGNGEQEAKAERKRLLDQFHDQHQVLRKEINQALAEVGLAPTDPLRKERCQKKYFWGLADTVQFRDLALLEQCQRLLADEEENAELHEQVVTACEQFSEVIGDMAVLKTYQETSGIENVLRETLITASKAMKYLAQEKRAEAQQTTDAKAKRRLLRKEKRYWAIYALSCARFASTLPAQYEHLSQQGEQTLRKALICCVKLVDPDRASALYRKYREAKEEDGDPWEPEATTQDLWRRALALDGDEAA
jgi:hypothetical protein